VRPVVGLEAAASAVVAAPRAAPTHDSALGRRQASEGPTDEDKVAGRLRWQMVGEQPAPSNCARCVHASHTHMGHQAAWHKDEEQQAFPEPEGA